MDSPSTSSSSAVWVARGRWLCLVSFGLLLHAALHSLSQQHHSRGSSGAAEGRLSEEVGAGGGASASASSLSLPLSVWVGCAVSGALGVVGSVWWSGPMVGVLAAPTFALRSTSAVYGGGGGGQGGEFRSFNHRGRGRPQRSSDSSGSSHAAQPERPLREKGGAASERPTTASRTLDAVKRVEEVE